MDVITYTDLRQNLAKMMDKVCDDRAPLVVSRQKHEAVVMMSLAEYRALEETLHLLRHPANAERLMRSIGDADAGRVEEHELVEPDGA